MHYVEECTQNIPLTLMKILAEIFHFTASMPRISVALDAHDIIGSQPPVTMTSMLPRD